MSGEITVPDDFDRMDNGSITRTPREGWDNAFAAMHLNGDDVQLIDDALDLRHIRKVKDVIREMLVE